MSKIVAIGERAWLRAAGRGDTEAMERAEIWLRRAADEQAHYDAAEFAEVEQSVAIAELVGIHRRDNP